MPLPIAVTLRVEIFPHSGKTWRLKSLRGELVGISFQRWVRSDNWKWNFLTENIKDIESLALAEAAFEKNYEIDIVDLLENRDFLRIQTST